MTASNWTRSRCHPFNQLSHLHEHQRVSLSEALQQADELLPHAVTHAALWHPGHEDQTGVVLICQRQEEAEHGLCKPWHITEPLENKIRRYKYAYYYWILVNQHPIVQTKWQTEMWREVPSSDKQECNIYISVPLARSCWYAPLVFSWKCPQSHYHIVAAVSHHVCLNVVYPSSVLWLGKSPSPTHTTKTLPKREQCAGM